MTSLHAVAGFTDFARIFLLIAPIMCLRSYCSFHSCCCLLPAIAGSPAVWFSCPAVDGVLALASFPADPGVPILAGGFKEWEDYTIGLSEYSYRTVIFSAIELAEYWISYWRIQETIGLSNIRSRPHSIGISDVGLRKNYRFFSALVNSRHNTIITNYIHHIRDMTAL